MNSAMPWTALRGGVPAAGDAARDSGHLHLRTEGGIMVRVPAGIVDGKLRIRNYRGTDVKLIVNLGFSGEFISAATEPDERRVLGSSVFSINKRQQMRWTLLLKPGEEQTLAYQYSVLVRSNSQYGMVHRDRDRNRDRNR